MLELTNTLSGKKEEFKPITPGKVGMYNCGPTVYDYAHIGNLRAYIFVDTLRRTVEYLGYTVKQVMNITDVGHLSSDADQGEDKMTKALVRLGKPMTTEAMREVANTYFETFKNDLTALNIELPHYFPFASDHLDEIVYIIQKLEEKGFAYKISDGIYFDISKDREYGKLGGLSGDDEHSRVGVNSEKRNSRDFALWKLNSELGYESPLGKGFPGWHIECSAMSMKYLGETFDIHTGGIEHIPIHHNNEIAQSESATGKQFVNYWIHNNHLTVDSGKMAKSEGTGYTLKDVKDHNLSPLAFRYFALQARYNSLLNFTWEAVGAAQTAFEKLARQYKEMPEGGKLSPIYQEKFKSFIEDDLDIPQVLALVWELLKDESVSTADKKATLHDFDRVLGLDLENVNIEREINIETLPDNVQKLIAKREEARKNRDFATSDKLREELGGLGYKIDDRPEGPQISLGK